MKTLDAFAGAISPISPTGRRVPALQREIAPKPALLGTFDPASRSAPGAGPWKDLREPCRVLLGARCVNRYPITVGKHACTRPAPRARLPKTRPHGETLDEHIDQCNSERSRLANPHIPPTAAPRIARTPMRLNRGWPRASAHGAVIRASNVRALFRPSASVASRSRPSFAMPNSQAD